MSNWQIGILVLAITCSASAAPIEPVREGQQSAVSRAVFLDDRLWLLSDAGELSSIDEGQRRRVDEPMAEAVHDICVHEGKLLAATCRRDGCAAGSLRRFDSGSWSQVATFHLAGDRVLALACASPTVTVLTTDRLIEFPAGEPRELRLSESLDGAPIATVHATPKDLFVGINAGEWGGGLWRIDRMTGRAEVVEHNASGELCGGPLNAHCDPVNGIATSPWSPGCIVAAIGLVHMRQHGRIVEVCGSQIRRLYYKEQPSFWPERDDTAKDEAKSKDDEPFSTTAFFGLAAHGHSLWAVGVDGIHEIAADGTARITPLSEFQDIGGIAVNFSSPDVVLVLTDVNRRRSLSGSVPLLVPRNP